MRIKYIYATDNIQPPKISTDTKASKKYAFYTMLVFDIFFIIIGVGLCNIAGLIIIFNVIIWLVLELRWLNTYDGLNETYFFYKASVYLVNNIEKCVIEEDTITFTLTYKLLFLNVVKTIELEIHKDEISILSSLIKNTRVELKNIR